MRIFLLALMIVLLPLRGWMGDAMATSMATGMAASNLHQEVATKTVATHAHETEVESTEKHAHHETDAQHSTQAQQDCAGHSSAQADQSTQINDGHCGSCQVCQVCHSVALSPAAVMVAAAFNAFALPHTATAQFTSAQLALRQKPPIF